MATTITPQLVTLNTTVTSAPQPSQLQQSAALVSAGGTSLATGTYQYCGQLSDVTGITDAAIAITSLAWSTGTVTATVPAMTLSTGQTFLTTIAGATPTAYNGTFLATVASSTTFTYSVATDPGSETAPGTYTPPYVAFLIQASTTFFGQGSGVGVYVLELGAENTSQTAITALGTWITDNPNVFYTFGVDASWDSTNLATLASGYASPSSKTYFAITTTQNNLTDYAGTKSVLAMVPAPSAAGTEVDMAAMLYQWTVQNPNAAALAQPMLGRQLYGVTAWPSYGQSAAVNAILTGYGNLVYPGVEGGLPTNNYLFRGTTMDGKQAMFWYAVDWFQIQVKIALANAILNAANSLNPIVYNQAGINALQAIAQGIADASIAFGLNLTVTVSATSFATYIAQNPSNYAAGIYNGLSATVTPQLGIGSITFNLDATTFA